jgi:hypothetical protein
MMLIWFYKPWRCFLYKFSQTKITLKINLFRVVCNNNYIKLVIDSYYSIFISFHKACKCVNMFPALLNSMMAFPL